MANELVTRSVSVTYTEMERIANNAVKCGFYGGVKTVDQAIMLMLIADADGIKPVEALMQYDIIGGKPALKSYAMLARFQAAGGKVEWLEATDDCVTGRFSHPAGGSVTVTWNTARVTAAGLMRNALHKTNGQQMKRARCISEGVKAVLPGCIPIGVYTPNEAEDIQIQRDDRNISTESAVNSFEQPMLEDAEDYLKDIVQAPTMEALKDNFNEAWKHAKVANDERRMQSLRTARDARRDELALDAADAKDAGEKQPEATI